MSAADTVLVAVAAVLVANATRMADQSSSDSREPQKPTPAWLTVIITTALIAAFGFTFYVILDMLLQQP